MPVVDSSRGQRSWESVDVELWIEPGFGHRPDVGHEVDTEALQQPDELLDRAGGMTDGVNGRHDAPRGALLSSGSGARDAHGSRLDISSLPRFARPPFRPTGPHLRCGDRRRDSHTSAKFT